MIELYMALLFLALIVSVAGFLGAFRTLPFWLETCLAILTMGVAIGSFIGAMSVIWIG